MQPELIKVPSACNTDVELLEYLCNNFRGDIHVSLGMTRLQEEHDLIEVFRKNNRLNSLVLYSCTSGYPVPAEDICLLEIQRLKNLYGDDIKGIGFSGHHLGTSIDIAAMALGAQYIERHFTLDKTWKGTDQVASLEPYELKKLIQDLETVNRALKFKNGQILEIEKVQRKKLKRKISE